MLGLPFSNSSRWIGSNASWRATHQHDGTLTHPGPAEFGPIYDQSGEHKGDWNLTIPGSHVSIRVPSLPADQRLPSSDMGQCTASHDIKLGVWHKTCSNNSLSRLELTYSTGVFATQSSRGAKVAANSTATELSTFATLPVRARPMSLNGRHAFVYAFVVGREANTSATQDY